MATSHVIARAAGEETLKERCWTEKQEDEQEWRE